MSCTCPEDWQGMDHTAGCKSRAREAADAARRLGGMFSECPGNPEGKVHCFNMETDRCVYCVRPTNPN